MGRKNLPPTTLLFPTPVVLVTSVMKQETQYHYPGLGRSGHSEPPMIGIPFAGTVFARLCEAIKEFVVNLPSQRWSENGCLRCSFGERGR